MVKKKSRVTAKKKSAKKKPRARASTRTARQSTPASAASTGGGGYVTSGEFRRAFGNLLVMGDNSTHAASGIDKFQQIKENIALGKTSDIFYLLASFVFDLHLRMVYIVEALEHVGPGDADRAFAKRVTEELLKINGDPKQPVKPWEDTARDAFAVMMAAHRRIHEKRQKVVRDALQ